MRQVQPVPVRKVPAAMARVVPGGHVKAKSENLKAVEAEDVATEQSDADGFAAREELTPKM